MSTKEVKINWWVPIVKGAVFFVLGIFIINQPDESMKMFITSLGLILMLIGIGLTAFSYYTRKTLSNYMSYLIFGVVQIILGIFIYFNPDWAGRILATIV